MDKISKALSRLTQKERNLVKNLLLKLKTLDFRGLNVKKLVGHDNIFRIKKGKLRIICLIEKSKPISILTIERRNDKTYEKFR